MSSAGLPLPPCAGSDLTSCQIGKRRAMLLTFYLLIGVPLFTLALAQITSVVLQLSIRHDAATKLTMPLTEQELEYASNLKSPRAETGPQFGGGAEAGTGDTEAFGSPEKRSTGEPTAGDAVFRKHHSDASHFRLHHTTLFGCWLILDRNRLH